MIELKNLTKTYKMKSGEVNALKGVNLELPDCGMIFVLGKSGCGKSTLLNVLGGLDNYTGGELIIDGISTSDYKAKDFDEYRNRHIGFIFQEYNLIDGFNVGKNVSLALELQKSGDKRATIDDVLSLVGLSGCYSRKISELSGGQRQRVAVARALVKNPRVILADEPTGNLDSTTAEDIFDILQGLSQDRLVLVVSHDRESAEKYADRIIELKDGEVSADRTIKEQQSVVEAKEDENVSPENDTGKLMDKRRQKVTKLSGNMSLKSTMSYALSNLWGKKFRVMASILLFIISLSFFNVAYGASRYNVYDTAYNTFKDAGYSYVNLTSGYENQKYDYIDKEFCEEAIPIYTNNNYIVDYSFVEKIESGYYDDRLAYSMPIDSGVVEKMGFMILHGRLPDKSTEVCISKYAAESILHIGKQHWDSLGINTIDGLLNNILDRSGLFKIVGIVDTQFPTKYDELRDKTKEEIRLMNSELSRSFEAQTGATPHMSLLCHESYFDDIYLPKGDTFQYMQMGTIPYERRIDGYSFNTLQIMGYDYHKVTDLSDGVVVAYSDAREFIVRAGLEDELNNYNYATIVQLLADHDVKAEMTYGKNDSYKFSSRIIGVYDDSDHSRNMFLSGSAKTQLVDNVMCLKVLVIDIDNEQAVKRAIDISGLVQKELVFRFNNNVIDEIEQTKIYAIQFRVIGGAAAALFAIMVAILLLNYFMSTIKDKNREIGVLRAIGVKNSNVMSIYLLEATLISIISFIIALPISFAVTNWLEMLTMSSLAVGYDIFVHFIYTDFISCLVTFALCIGVAFVGCIAPFVKLFKRKPMEIIRKK